MFKATVQLAFLLPGHEKDEALMEAISYPSSAP